MAEMTVNVKKLVDFLNGFGKRKKNPPVDTPQCDKSTKKMKKKKNNSFVCFCFGLIDLSTRNKLAKISERLSTLDRQMEFIEHRLRTAAGGD